MLKPIYKRVTLKLSGELMMGNLDFGIDLEYMRNFAEELVEVSKMGVQILVEVGGGNIYRWRQAPRGIKRNTADMMGMLGSVMTALNLRDVINERHQAEALISMQALAVAPMYTPRDAISLLSEGKIVIVGGGTGQQFFTTDTGAATHALQTEAEVLLKGTDVEGVFSADPDKDPKATIFDEITFDEVLSKRLEVMDMTAFALLRSAKIPIIVFDVREKGNLKQAIVGKKVGTVIKG